jgi:hypothetical protein
MCAPTKKYLLQGAAEALQPLREVGSMEKTQFWDIHEIMNALRIANRHGIPLNNLRSRQMLKAG